MQLRAVFLETRPIYHPFFFLFLWISFSFSFLFFFFLCCVVTKKREIRGDVIEWMDGRRKGCDILSTFPSCHVVACLCFTRLWKKRVVCFSSDRYRERGRETVELSDHVLREEDPHGARLGRRFILCLSYPAPSVVFKKKRVGYLCLRLGW